MGDPFNTPLFDGLGGITEPDDVQADIGLVGFWTFEGCQPKRDLGLDDGVSQNGHVHGNAFFADGKLNTDGKGDYFDVSGADDPFDLDQGTIAVQFTQDCHVGSQPNTVVNRGEAQDATSEGWFAIQVTKDGAVQVIHDAGGCDILLSTAPGFFSPGDELQVEYSWNTDSGAELSVKNVAIGEVSVTTSYVTGLTMDIGDNDDENFTFAAREKDDGWYDQFFDGEIDFVAVFASDDPLATDEDADGAVDGEAFGETMVLGYDDSNAPTDQGGDLITNGDDLIFGNGGNDTIDGAAGNDTIYGDDGGVPGVVSVTINSSSAGFNNELFAYVIDVETGVIDRIIPLSDGVKDEIGTTFTFEVGAGETVGLGIVSPQGTFLSSGYGSNIGLNPDSVLHTELVGVDPNGPVTIGFEDLFGLGDEDFNDVVVTIDLGTSGAEFDNAHVDYSSAGPGEPGDDVIMGGLGDDEIYGEDGNDTLSGGDGVDTLFGGDGDDDISGGLLKDTLFGGDGNDTLSGGNGADFLDGGDGDDFLDGGTGRDTLLGGAGDDTILGATGNDLIQGGDGDDLIDGGAGGSDTMQGGADADTFVNVDAGEVVDGGSGGDDNDTLDLTGSVQGNGSLSVTYTNPDSNGNGFDGFVTYFDEDGNETGKLEFTEIENVVPCFTPGTMIATPRGEVPIETLEVGDKVITRDNGIQTIQWIGRREMKRRDFDAVPYLCPIRISQGALGYGLPERDMLVSPQHRVLVANEKTALYFEEREVLVAAKHLTSLDGVEVAAPDDIDYIHLMFEQHEVLLSDGIWSESFQPGDMTLGAMGSEQREEIYQLFPELRNATGQSAYAAARRSLKKHEASILLQ